MGQDPYDPLDEDEWNTACPVPQKQCKGVEELEEMSSLPPPPPLPPSLPVPSRERVGTSSTKRPKSDNFQSVTEQEAERRLFFIAEKLKTNMDTLPPYVEELRSLSVLHGPSFTSVEDSAKILETYIVSIEALGKCQQSIVIIPPLPTSIGDMPKMMAKLPLVDSMDRAAVLKVDVSLWDKSYRTFPSELPLLNGSPIWNRS